MRKIFIYTITVLSVLSWVFLCATAFNSAKCDHAFTVIEQPYVKIELGPSMVNAIYTSPPTGKQEGSELICVKCFHKQKQVIDYGQAQQSYLSPIGNSLWGTSIDTCSLTLTSILGGSGFITLKVDTGFGLIK